MISYNILGIFQFPYRSNFLTFEPLLRTLAERGHNVTVISHFKLIDPPKNYYEISVKGSVQIGEDFAEVERLDDFESSKGHGLSTILRHYKESVQNCEGFLKWPSVKRLYHAKEEFDLILSEQFFGDCNLGFLNKFNCTYIALTSQMMLPWQFSRMNAIDNPAYIPGSLSRFSTKMSFVQRLENTVTNLLHKFLHNAVTQMSEQRILMKYFGSETSAIKELAKKTSILLVNSYFPLTGVFPRGANVIEVGGMHIRESKLPMVS